MPRESVGAAVAVGTRQVFYGWWIVGASLISLTVGVGPIIGLTFGVFLKPLATEFGWSRGEASLGISLALLGFTLMQPVVGRLVSRYGPKRVILTSALLFGLCLLSFRLLTSLRSYYVCAAAAGLVAGGTSPLPYGAMISHWFDERRGQALSLALSGLGIGGFLLPLIASYTTSHLGWRAAYTLLGFLVLLIILPVIGLVVREDPEQMGRVPDHGWQEAGSYASTPLPPQQIGYTLREAWGTATFWAMAGGFFLFTMAIQGSVVHLAPLFMDRGASLKAASFLVSLLSAGFLPGMLGSGYLVDRFPATHVTLGFFLLATVGLGILWLGSGAGSAFPAALLMGLGMGAEVQLIPYLVGWCFGLVTFSEIYGCVMAAFGLGTVMGPLLTGYLFDASGSYQLALGVSVAAAAVAAILMVPIAPMKLTDGSRTSAATPA